MLKPVIPLTTLQAVLHDTQGLLILHLSVYTARFRFFSYVIHYWEFNYTRFLFIDIPSLYIF